MGTKVKGMLCTMVASSAIAATTLLLPVSSGAAELLPVLHEGAANVNLALCQNEPQLKGILDKDIGSPRQTVGFDVSPVMLNPGQYDYRLQGQGIVLQGIAGSAQVGGTSDSGAVCGGHLGTGWGETRVRIHFVKPGTTTPAPVTQVGGFTTSEDAGRNCMEFYDASGTSLGSGCLQNSPWTPITTVEFLGGAYGPGIAYIDVISHLIPYELDLLTFRYVAENKAPVAEAGLDQTVGEGGGVVLDGSGSSDPEGQPLTYQWSQLSGTPVSLNLVDPVHPTFAAPLVPAGGGTLTFQLIVNDGKLNSPSDTVNISVKNLNHPPVAEAGTGQTVKEGASVQLDGSGSYDPDGELLTYQWTQTSGPAVTLIGGTGATPSFAAPLVGTAGAVLTFELVVSDGIGAASDTVAVTVENVNHAPLADAGGDQTRNEGGIVVLDGSASSDPDLDPLSFAWRQVAGQPVVLANQAGANPNFTAPEVGPGGETLVFELVVNDGQVASTPDTVAVQVLNVNDPPACGAARPLSPVLWPPNHKLVPVQIAGVTDPNNQNVTIRVTGVTQDEPVNGLGDGDVSPDAVLQGNDLLLRAERSGTGTGRVYRVNFTADDGDGGTCSGSVNVTVPHSKGQGVTAVDDGQLYDATQP
jgi:hypothetical protein